MSGEGRKWPREVDVSDDVAREIEAHIAMRAEELEREGWPLRAAREEAERLFGDRRAVSRRCERITKSHRRVVGRTRMLGAVWQDVRFGVRSLVRSPGFALVAVLTLALGIGANAAIFSVVNGVLIRGLPFEDPQEIVWMREISTRGRPMAVAWANFRDWHDELSSLESVTAYSAWSTTVLGGSEPVRARVANVTEDFWGVFEVAPAQGRLTTAEDHRLGATPAVLVSRSFWENQLSSRPIGSLTIEARGLRADVVGVVDEFDFPGRVDVWIPAELVQQADSRSAHNWSVVGRLADGASIVRAAEETDALTRLIVQEAAADENPDYLATGALVLPLQEQLVGGVRTPLLLLFGAAGFVLLIACTNLASTMLARGTGRARELAVRMSLGAGKGRVVRQLLTESVVIALLGAAAGTALASGLMSVLRTLGADSVPRLEEVTMDPTVFGFTAAVSVLTAFLFGLVPALRLTSAGTGEAMRSGSRGNAVDARAPIWRVLVGTEVALALVLLVGSGLLVRSSRALLREDPGIDASDVASLSVALSTLRYATPEDHARWYDEFLSGVEAMPGVAGVGLISSLPVSGGLANGALSLDGSAENEFDAGYVVASGGAFEALDIPLVRGRLFDDRDRAGTEHVAIVSRSFAESAWPGVDPIGRRVSGGGMDNFWEESVYSTVVGVVDDVRFRSLGEEEGPVVYFPYTQRPFRIQYGAAVVVETADPSALTGALRTALRRADSDVPFQMTLARDAVRASVGERRFVMFLFGGFAVVALALATVGIFGVVSYGVARRTREMGIRIALGADLGEVRSLVVGASMRMVAWGLLVGTVAAVLLSRVMEGLLFGVTPNDPLTVATVVLGLLATGWVASWLPARAGTRVDPMVTMRAE